MRQESLVSSVLEQDAKDEGPELNGGCSLPPTPATRQSFVPVAWSRLRCPGVALLVPELLFCFLKLGATFGSIPICFAFLCKAESHWWTDQFRRTESQIPLHARSMIFFFLTGAWKYDLKNQHLVFLFPHVIMMFDLKHFFYRLKKFGSFSRGLFHYKCDLFLWICLHYVYTEFFHWLNHTGNIPSFSKLLK